jgi:glycosyltransferase involved in cell wall biosynthesis
LAVLRAAEKRYKLLVVGDGEEASALRNLAVELGCTDAVTFTGAVPRARMPAMLSAGNVFIFPALGREGLPLNVLEALGVGLPCVCAESLRETFGAFDAIAYAAAGDSQALAGAVRTVALHAPPTTSLLPAEYSLQRCVDAYEALLRACVRS